VYDKGESITFADPRVYLKIGETFTPKASVLPGTANQEGTWTVVSGESVGTLDAKGVYTVKAAGHAVLKFKTAEGLEANMDVFAGDRVTGAAFTGAGEALTVGSSKKLAPVVVPTSAVDISGTYSSNNPVVATVDKEGNVTANHVGTAKITFKTNDGGFEAVCDVTVTADTTHQVVTKGNTATIGDGNYLNATLDAFVVTASLVPAEDAVTYTFTDVEKSDKLTLTPNGDKCTFQASAALETRILVQAKVGDATYSTYFILVAVPEATPTPSPGA
jgi:uncharacterized protein YjdB